MIAANPAMFMDSRRASSPLNQFTMLNLQEDDGSVKKVNANNPIEEVKYTRNTDSARKGYLCIFILQMR